MKKSLNEKSEKETPQVRMAKIMMQQIERENDKCGFWLVSVFCKLKGADPQMNMVCAMNIIKDAIPKSHAKYMEYLKYT